MHPTPLLIVDDEGLEPPNLLGVNELRYQLRQSSMRITGGTRTPVLLVRS